MEGAAAMSLWCTRCKCCRAQEGFDLCVFCEDGKICPGQVRAELKTAPPHVMAAQKGKKEEETMEHGNPCKECGKPMRVTNTSGYCKQCRKNDPAVDAKAR